MTSSDSGRLGMQAAYMHAARGLCMSYSYDCFFDLITKTHSTVQRTYLRQLRSEVHLDDLVKYARLDWGQLCRLNCCWWLHDKQAES